MKHRGTELLVLLAAMLIAMFLLQGIAGAEPPALLHNGVPQFMIGTFYYPGEYSATNHLAEISVAGFNCYWRQLSAWTGNEDVTILTGADVDAAYNTYGMDTIAYAGPYMADVARYGTVFDAAITDIKDRTGLLVWETYDEPEWNWYNYGAPTLASCIAGHNFVLARDTNHPVWCVFAPPNITLTAPPMQGRSLTIPIYQQWSGLTSGYAPGAGSAFAMDSYPATGNYPNDNLAIIGTNIDYLKTMTNQTKPLCAVVQGCKYNQWNGDQTHAAPQFIETRFMVYDSIVHGAKGVVWWGTHALQPTDQMWTDIKVVAGELRDLQDIWASNTTTAGVTLGSTNLEAILKVVDGNRYLIVANKSSATLTNKSINVTGWNYARPGNKVLVVFENNRTISTTSTTWYDSFEPWGVHVYVDNTLPPSAPGTPNDSGVFSTSTSVVFNWTAAAGVSLSIADYKCQIGTTPGGNDIFDGWVGNVLTKTITGSDGVTYYCRARAKDTAGNIGPWSGNSNGVMVDVSGPIAGTPTDAGVATASATIVFNWPVATDPAGVTGYYCQIGTSPGGSNYYNGWLGNVTTKTIFGSNGVTYYCRVKAKDQLGHDGLWSASSDGIMVDNSAPSTAIPTDSGAYTVSNSVVFNFSGTDSGSGIGGYFCQIGTSPGGNNYYDGYVAATSKTIIGSTGVTYYCRAKAKDNAGNIGSSWSGSSDGITVVGQAGLTVAELKTMANSITVGLSSKMVTAVFADCFYIQEANRTSGIKVIPLVPIGVVPGSLVDVGGTLNTSPAGERYIVGSVLLK